MNWSKITWQQVAMAAIIAPCASLLVYGLVSKGETFGGIAAAVAAILAALGWSASRTNTKLDKVEKLANGNLSRAEEQRAQAQQQAIDHLHAVYQQLIQVAAQAPLGTVIPPLPASVSAPMALQSVPDDQL